MIQLAREAKPFIHFGFNKLTFLEKQVGRPIRIYIDGNFNKDIYTISILTTGVVTQITSRIYEIDFNAAGTESIQVEFTNTQTSEVVLSNIIDTELYLYTFDNDELSFDNTIITFDNEQ